MLQLCIFQDGIRAMANKEQIWKDTTRNYLSRGREKEILKKILKNTTSRRIADSFKKRLKEGGFLH